MKLIINAESLQTPLTGIGTYTRHLAEELDRMAEVESLRCYFRGRLVEPKECLAFADAVRHEESNRQDKRVAFWNRVSDFTSLPYQLHKFTNARLFKRHTRDSDTHTVYHEPNYILKPWPGPAVITVHDLSVLHYPQFHPKARVRHVGKNLKHSLAKAARVITDSNFVRHELLERFELEEDKVVTCHLGVSDHFQAPGADATAAICERYDIKPDGYALCVGTMEPRKNVARLIAAFVELPDDMRRAFPLVLVGSKGWGGSALASRMQPLIERGEIRSLGYVPRADLPALYSGARVFVFPSLYEGFGLPVLEAMACGTPVVTSENTCMAEVTGDAAVLIDATETQAMRMALEKVLQNDALRDELSQAGLERARQFTWQACAQLHRDVYRQALTA